MRISIRNWTRQPHPDPETQAWLLKKGSIEFTCSPSDSQVGTITFHQSEMQCEDLMEALERALAHRRRDSDSAVKERRIEEAKEEAAIKAEALSKPDPYDPE